MSGVSMPNVRFREFRERACLSQDDAAQLMGLSSMSIWDIEIHEDELMTGYSPSEVQLFCRILGVRPAELFGVEIESSPISADELVRLIHEQCRLRGVTLVQFEGAVGWRLSACIETPEHLLEDITIDGLQWLCQELGMDWRRVILAL